LIKKEYFYATHPNAVTLAAGPRQPQPGSVFLRVFTASPPEAAYFLLKYTQTMTQTLFIAKTLTSPSVINQNL
jgi:hypothetical protein